jgi:hypothetical protein
MPKCHSRDLTVIPLVRHGPPIRARMPMRQHATGTASQDRLGAKMGAIVRRLSEPSRPAQAQYPQADGLWGYTQTPAGSYEISFASRIHYRT